MSQNSHVRRPLFNGEPFEQVVAILIALVTIIAAVSGVLQSDAGARSDAAFSAAQRFSLQAMGERSRGEVQAGYAWTDAYRTWLEMDSLAYAARQRGDTAMAAGYETVRDRLSQVNPLLRAPYFDASAGAFPDLAAYEADLFLVESTALAEHFANSSNLSDQWGSKSGAYINQLTLLTVAFFLLGLSVTIVGRVRWIFVVMGTVISGITVAQMAFTAVQPVGSLSDAAIDAYAKGVGLAYQDKNDRAVQAFDEAVREAPDYANAYYERAKAASKIGALDQAAADYEQAILAGRADAWAYWNLGWTSYLLGRFDEARSNTQLALELAPDQVGPQFNLGLTALARGDTETARARYAGAMALATQQVADAKAAGKEAPVSLWWYLSASGLDLDHLIACRSEGVCKGAPPPTALAMDSSAAAEAAGLRQELKVLAVALESTGLPPGPPGSAQIAAVSIVEPMYDASGALAGYQPYDPARARLRSAGVFEAQSEAASLSVARRTGAGADLLVSFDYGGMQDGQSFIVKVYVDGREVPGLRMAERWTLGAQGTAVLPLSPGGAYELSAGDYRIEVYVASHLLQESAFTIQ